MRIAKAATFVVAALATAALGQTSHRHTSAKMHQSSNKAWALFERTMELDRYIPCRGVMDQRMSLGESTMMRMWAEQSAEGKLKLSVLSPLSQQGIICVDDGHQWLTYHPDENQVYVQPSPRLSLAPVAERVSRARVNYTLDFQSSNERVAGRKVFALIAIPKHSQMPKRRYCIDQDKPFLLRMQIIANGKVKTMMDMKQVEYPGEVPEEEFAIQPPSPAKLVTMSSPSRSPAGRDAKRLVGFRPAIPRSLPFGFAIEHPELGGANNKRFVAVRISDGLVNATVYEWNSKHGSKGLGGDTSHDRVARGIGLRVVGEIPEVVMVKLLDAFVRQALKEVEPMFVMSGDPETLALYETLNSEQKSSISQILSQASLDAGPGEVVVAFVEV